MPGFDREFMKLRSRLDTLFTRVVFRREPIIVDMDDGGLLVIHPRLAEPEATEIFFVPTLQHRLLLKPTDVVHRYDANYNLIHRAKVRASISGKLNVPYLVLHNLFSIGVDARS